ncbi:MAG: hypothetical protein JST10_16805 [Bacteroidetes bacterium]|nr:hypothetical protein [Bacteroidota bacterium]
METLRATVPKQPSTNTELEHLINESLKGKDPHTQQDEILEEYEADVKSRVEQEKTEANEKYDELIKHIAEEKKIQKVLAKQGDAAWRQAMADREKEINAARELQLTNIQKTYSNRKQYLEKVFRFFFVSRNLKYPIETYTGGSELVPAVFLGFVIDKKKKNPYAPSVIKLRFAIANSSKYLAIPASYSEDIMAIIGASADLHQPSLNVLLSEWDSYTKENNADRRIRHIITGNLLQAFSDFKGKLVSYTTLDGETRKGILLPENWNPAEQVQDRVVVPILKGASIIKSLVQNAHIVTNNGISFFRTGDYYKVIVAASRVKGGAVYLDKQILELVEKNNFEKVSDKMVAMLPASNIDKMIEVLQNNHSASLTINSSQFSQLKNVKERFRSRKPIELPSETEEVEDDELHILELEADALALELELLAA